jgi:hypothetical protein
MSSFSANTLRKDVALSGKKCRLISSTGTAHEIPLEYANASEHLKNTIEISSEEEVYELDFPQIDDNTMKSLIIFMTEYTMEPYAPLPNPIPQEGLYSLIRPFYQDFLNIKMVADGTCDPATFTGEPAPDSSNLEDLIQAAHLLQIDGLSALVKAKMFDVVRGKNIKDMFKIFNIEDHVPEWSEMERIRTEYAHLFESDGSA